MSAPAALAIHRGNIVNHFSVSFPHLSRCFRVKSLLTNMRVGGVKVDDPAPYERRLFRPRPRVSVGGMASLAAGLVSLFTLLAAIWQGAHYFNSIDMKLDAALQQGAAIVRLQNDILILQTKFDTAQKQAEGVMIWLQNLARRVEGGRPVEGTSPSRAAGGPGQ